MTLRLRYLLAALGLWMMAPLPAIIAEEALHAREPARLAIGPAAADEQLAQAIASSLRSGGQLRHYCIDVAVRAGTAELIGHVASEHQRDEALRLARGVAGVDQVIDHLAVQTAGVVMPVQAEAIQAPKVPPQLPRAPTPVNANPIVEPMPMMAGQPTTPYDLTPPKMPPYAWPTYAPYNNYSRVAYPTAYPYNAFPFIGPPYPFPKVPLGWRKVKLEWQDGHWWFGKVGGGHDWWRLRYW